MNSTIYYYSPITGKTYAGNTPQLPGDISIPEKPADNDESLILYWDNEVREWKTKPNENYINSSRDITLSEADELLQKSNTGDINSVILLRMLGL